MRVGLLGLAATGVAAQTTAAATTAAATTAAATTAAGNATQAATTQAGNATQAATTQAGNATQAATTQAAPAGTTQAAPAGTTQAAPVVTTTAAPVVTTTAAPVVTTTAAPVVTTTAAPVPTTTPVVVPTLEGALSEGTLTAAVYSDAACTTAVACAAATCTTEEISAGLANPLEYTLGTCYNVWNAGVELGTVMKSCSETHYIAMIYDKDCQNLAMAMTMPLASHDQVCGGATTADSTATTAAATTAAASLRDLSAHGQTGAKTFSCSAVAATTRAYATVVTTEIDVPFTKDDTEKVAAVKAVYETASTASFCSATKPCGADSAGCVAGSCGAISVHADHAYTGVLASAAVSGRRLAAAQASSTFTVIAPAAEVAALQTKAATAAASGDLTSTKMQESLVAALVADATTSAFAANVTVAVEAPTVGDADDFSAAVFGVPEGVGLPPAVTPDDDDSTSSAAAVFSGAVFGLVALAAF